RMPAIGKPYGQMVLEMGDIDDDLLDAVGTEAVEGVLDHRFAGHGDERFWEMIRERLEAGAVTGGEDHGFPDLNGHGRSSTVSGLRARDVAGLAGGGVERAANGGRDNRVCLHAGRAVRK